MLTYELVPAHVLPSSSNAAAACVCTLPPLLDTAALALVLIAKPSTQPAVLSCLVLSCCPMLLQLIATGLPARGATRSTAGCHIHVKLVDNTAAPGTTGYHQHSSPAQQLQGGGSFSPLADKQQQHSSLPAQRKFFVELWDVSGQPKYSQLRSVFFKQLNGVILVYDVTNKASLSRLQKWAAEVAHEGEPGSRARWLNGLGCVDWGARVRGCLLCSTHCSSSIVALEAAAADKYVRRSRCPTESLLTADAIISLSPLRCL